MADTSNDGDIHDAQTAKSVASRSTADLEEQLAEDNVFDKLQANARDCGHRREEAAQFSQGAIAVVEVWVFDPKENRLVLERGECWTCPSLGSVIEMKEHASAARGSIARSLLELIW
jgi:hypothetical protein